MSSAFEGLPKTPNLKLNKPGYDNVADIEALNENSDILDDEINTIKSNLKNKGSATEPIYFDGNGVPQKTKNFNDYLPLAGGIMTGAIETNGDIINPSNNNTFIRIKGSKEYQQGAELLLSGKTLTDHEGLFYLIANNGTKSTKLLGKADGNLLWGAKHIVRSVNGINATPDGNVNLKIIPIANGGTGANNSADACANLGALPLTGGSLTGDVYSRQGILLGVMRSHDEAIDLNNILEAGLYYLSYYEHANSPKGSAINGFLEVLCGNKANTYRIQKFYETGGPTNTEPNIYYRKQVSGNWSPWFKYRVLVASSVSANNWFARYSDGWVEQGGDYNTVTDIGTITITLPKPMADTNYNVLVSKTSFGGGSGLPHVSPTITSKTTTKFVVTIGYSYQFGKCCFTWRAYGKGA